MADGAEHAEETRDRPLEPRVRPFPARDGERRQQQRGAHRGQILDGLGGLVRSEPAGHQLEGERVFPARRRGAVVVRYRHIAFGIADRIRLVLADGSSFRSRPT